MPVLDIPQAHAALTVSQRIDTSSSRRRFAARSLWCLHSSLQAYRTQQYDLLR
jgi:hypothetical protein